MMDKTICKNWEINYECSSCGQKIMNATKEKVNCDNCGRRLKKVHPLNSREERKWA